VAKNEIVWKLVGRSRCLLEGVDIAWLGDTEASDRHAVDFVGADRIVVGPLK
jgi:hypothetical protein